eukprot:5485541-Pyramimonas_sp.AAC.1
MHHQRRRLIRSQCLGPRAARTAHPARRRACGAPPQDSTARARCQANHFAYGALLHAVQTTQSWIAACVDRVLGLFWGNSLG